MASGLSKTGSGIPLTFEAECKTCGLQFTVPFDRFNDEHYINWLKDSLCLQITKEGLENFVETTSQEFYDNIKGDILTASACSSQCDLHDFRRDTFKCPKRACDALKIQLINASKKHRIEWGNTTLKDMISSPRNVSKLFMPSMCKAYNGPKEADCTAVLALMGECIHFNNKLKYPHVVDYVRESRNTIMHSGTMRLGQHQLLHHTSNFIALLSDPDHLKQNPKCIEAIKQIQQITDNRVKMDLVEVESTVMDQHTKLRQDEIKDLKEKVESPGQTEDELKTAKYHLKKLEEKEIKMKVLMEFYNIDTATVDNDLTTARNLSQKVEQKLEDVNMKDKKIEELCQLLSAEQLKRRDDNARLSSKNENHQKEIEKLHYDRDKNNAMKGLEDVEMKRSGDRSEEHNNDNAEFSSEIENLQKQIEKLQHAIGTIQDVTMKATDEKIEKLSQRFSTEQAKRSNDNARFSSENENLQKQIEICQHDLDKFHAIKELEIIKMKEKDNRIEELHQLQRAQQSKHSNERAEFSVENEIHKKQIEKLQHDLNTIHAMKRLEDVKMKEKDEKIEELYERLSTEQAKRSSDNAKLSSENENLQQQIEKCQHDLDKIHAIKGLEDVKMKEKIEELYQLFSTEQARCSNEHADSFAKCAMLRGQSVIEKSKINLPTNLNAVPDEMKLGTDISGKDAKETHDSVVKQSNKSEGITSDLYEAVGVTDDVESEEQQTQLLTKTEILEQELVSYKVGGDWSDGITHPSEIKLSITNKTVADLNIIANMPDAGNCVTARLCYSPVGRVISGNFEIIKVPGEMKIGTDISGKDAKETYDSVVKQSYESEENTFDLNKAVGVTDDIEWEEQQTQLLTKTEKLEQELVSHKVGDEWSDVPGEMKMGTDISGKDAKETYDSVVKQSYESEENTFDLCKAVGVTDDIEREEQQTQLLTKTEKTEQELVSHKVGDDWSDVPGEMKMGTDISGNDAKETYDSVVKQSYESEENTFDLYKAVGVTDDIEREEQQTQLLTKTERLEQELVSHKAGDDWSDVPGEMKMGTDISGNDAKETNDSVVKQSYESEENTFDLYKAVGVTDDIEREEQQTQLLTKTERLEQELVSHKAGDDWSDEKEKENQCLHVTYSPARDEYCRLSQDREVTNGFERLVYKHENLFRKVGDDCNMLCLARTETCNQGAVAWKFDFTGSALRIDSIDVKIDCTTFANDTIHWLICGGENIYPLKVSPTLQRLENLRGDTVFKLTAFLYGGKGDVALQHTELFRQPHEDLVNCPFEIRVHFSLEWSNARREFMAQAQTSVEPYIFQLSEKEKQNKRLHLTYTCARDEYCRLSQDGEVIKGFTRLLYKLENMFRTVDYDRGMVYLARTKRYNQGYLAWKFDFKGSDLRIDSIDVKIDCTTFENGTIHWLIVGEKSLHLKVSPAIQRVEDLRGETEFMLTASLSGGKGDVAWQHAQLFRQPCKDLVCCPFEICVHFSLEQKLARGALCVQVQKPEEPYIFQLSEKEKQNKCLHVTYSCARDTYCRLSQDGEVTKGFMKLLHKLENMFRNVDYDQGMVYLARTESFTQGDIAWKFDFTGSGLKIDSIEVKIDCTTFKNGKIHWLICGEKKSYPLKVSPLPQIVKELRGKTGFMLTASLSGGKGNVAWQHAQLFRQRREDIFTWPFEICVHFK